MRLVDADALKLTFCRECTLRDGRCPEQNGGECYDSAVYHLKHCVPTVDAVPVVRCKECRWWDKIGDSPIGYCHACKHGYCSSHWEISIHRTYKGDFFCADGERKDGDDNG